MPSRQAMGWTFGTRRVSTTAEDILSDAVGWWDVSTYREGDRILRNLGTGRDLLNLQLGSSLEPNTNDPLYLPVRDEGYLYMGGSVTVPDSDAISFTTDFDIMVRLRAGAWSVGDRTLFIKSSASPNVGYQFQILNNGNWRLLLSTDGISSISIDTLSNPVNNFIVGQTYWIRVTYQSNDGSGSRNTKFYWANDSISIPTSWNQIGATATGTAYTINNSIAPLTIGSAVPGEYYRFVMRNGYDGAGITVLDADFTNLTFSTTSFNATGVGDSGFVSSGRYTLKGRAGEYLSTPNNTALNITTDLDIRARVALDDWTPSTVNTIVSKYGAATLRSYILNVNTSGTLSLTWSADGTNTITSTSSVATGITDGAIKWVRATLDVDNGASGNDVAFYLSDDGATWTQLGTTITTAGTTSVSNNASVLEIGTNTTGTLNPLSGNVYKVIIVNGIGLVGDNTTPTTGTLVFSANCEQQSVRTITFNAAGTNAIRNGGFVRVPAGGGIVATASTFTTSPIIGGLDVKAKITPNVWPPTNVSSPLSSTAVTFRLNTTANGTIQLNTTDGITTTNGPASNTLPITLNTAKWIRATLNPNDGSGNRVYKFYTSDDGTTWTQLGTTQTVAGAITIATISGAVEFGSNAGGNNAFRGTYHRLIVQSTFDAQDNVSNLLMDVDLESQNDGTTSFVDTFNNTITVTGNSFPMTTNGTNPLVSLTRGVTNVTMPSRQNGGSPLFLCVTDDRFEIPIQNVFQHQLLSVRTGEPFTAFVVARVWVVGGGQGLFNKGINNAQIGNPCWYTRGGGGNWSYVLNDGATGTGYSSTGTNIIGAKKLHGFTIANQTIQAFTSTVRGVATNAKDANEVYNSSSRFIICGADGGVAPSLEFYAAAVFRRALTNEEIKILSDYYGAP